jgi:hypothetical protein
MKLGSGMSRESAFEHKEYTIKMTSKTSLTDNTSEGQDAREQMTDEKKSIMLRGLPSIDNDQLHNANLAELQSNLHLDATSQVATSQ